MILNTDNGKSRIKEHHIKVLVVSIVYDFCLTIVTVICKFIEHFSVQGWSQDFQYFFTGWIDLVS